ncbi:MAG: hypothetical protein SFY80_02990 [Verrucomicrobiota bacterium]|nr:hypothetical protein [Verrucomicrobiota bacterium]
MLVFLTCLTNGLLNSILAMVLGSGLRARQTTISILLSFAIFSVIVGAVSPVAFFMTMNIPPPGSGSESISHGATLLMHTIVIASAGIFGNWKLYQVLALSTPNKTIAGRTLFAWLAGNLFLGAQFSWILRPFFGSPTLAVQFLRDHPMQGNFYEAVYNTLLALLRNL